MSITRVFCGRTNFLTALPGDAFGEIVSHLEKRDVETLMYVSKQVAEKWLNAEHGWRSFLTDRYRHVANPVSVVKESWIQKRDMEKIAARTHIPPDDYFYQWNPRLPDDKPYDPLIQGAIERVMSLSPWEARGPENTITPSEIAEWSAIEMVFKDAMKRYEAQNAQDTSYTAYQIALDIRDIGMVALMARDYVSHRLISELGRRSDLISSFFTLFTCSKSVPWKRQWNDTQWKELARFVLQNYYVIGAGPSFLKQLKTWFGSELPALLIEYRIFGEAGISLLKNITWDIGQAWKEFLLAASQLKIDANICHEQYVCHAQYALEKLVLVSKHVFHHPEQLVDFILSVLQKVNKEMLSKAGMHVDALDEFLVDSEGPLKDMIDDVVQNDEAPFCEHSQYEEDRDFIYGRLGPYLFSRLLGIPF